ncbi:Cof-type HAD-IIB family hydrolase [Parablastomonas sp. CN1-191]|uniref:Cof-type HAD-IIB family hydrolase n=1 Tax=Parablastomonas sp. CN1-191 TaxID=3400908 RepID=UPI003BF77780
MSLEQGERAGPIGLVVSDIDGTLVRRDKSLPDANVAAVKAVTARGVPVSLISARPPSGILPIARALGLPGPFAAFNGGTLFDDDGTIREAHRLDDDLAVEAARRILAAGMTLWTFAAGKWFASDVANPHTDRERLSAGLEPDSGTPAGPRDKLVAVCDDAARLSAMEQDLRALAGPRATVIRSQAYYLDVTAPAANKGDGLAALAALYGVAPGAVAVLGDQANDIAMFRRAGLSVAMGQATPDVAAEADHVAAANEADGVADGLERFIVPRL